MAVGCGKSKGEIVKKIESSTGKSSGSKRWFIIMAVAVLEVAVVGGGGLWRQRNAVQKYDQAFAFYKAVVRFYKVQGGANKIPGI